MFLIKISLTAIAGISICMGNISGTVTDSVGVGMAGAVVKLETGGQIDTTESDGKFTLVTDATDSKGPINQAPAKKPSVTMHNGLLRVNVAEKSFAEITIFNLNGKALSRRCRLVAAGSSTMALPRRGPGIYLFKVKAGNNEFVLKGNSDGGISFGGSLTSQGSSSKHFVKRAMRAAIVNDVIAATKPGYLNFRMIIENADTSGITIRMIASAGTITDVEGNEYQTVRIGNKVWMAENLRATKYDDGSLIPLDTSTSAWDDDSTPKYCFFKNTTDSDYIRKYGALYNWYVVNHANPKNIAPTGWRVPYDADWDDLQSYLIANGYNWDGTTMGNKIAKSLAAKTDWNKYSTVVGAVGNCLTKNNSSGFSALPGGDRGYLGKFGYQKTDGIWWSATSSVAPLAWTRSLTIVDVDLSRLGLDKNSGVSVRLVRD